VILMMNLIIII